VQFRPISETPLVKGLLGNTRSRHTKTSNRPVVGQPVYHHPPCKGLCWRTAWRLVWGHCGSVGSTQRCGGMVCRGCRAHSGASFLLLTAFPPMPPEVGSQPQRNATERACCSLRARLASAGQNTAARRIVRPQSVIALYLDCEMRSAGLSFRSRASEQPSLLEEAR
jgi:hypothetical protein